MLRFFAYFFWGLFLLSVIALGRQLGAEHLRAAARSKTLRASPEGWFLFVVVIVVDLCYLSNVATATKMAPIGPGWIWGYGASCLIYLAVKSIRMFCVRS